MASVVLETRPSDYFEWLEEMPDEAIKNVYALAIIEALPFPGERHPEGTPFSVVCAHQYITEQGERSGEYLWGWVHLGPDTKKELGDALENGGAEIGKWYYLRISSRDKVDNG